MNKFKTPIINIKKYGGKQVAIVRGKIVASGIDTSEVLDRARKAVRKEDYNEIWLLMVPKSLNLIYFI